MSTTEWTILEKLLLSQAVYKYGEDNWFQIARNLKHHALLDRPSDYFNQKSCSLQYYLMVENLEKQNPLTQDMPPVVQIARELYTLRLKELKQAISQDEEKFLQLVTEIDEIRAGKWDDQLLGLPKNTPTEQPQPTAQQHTVQDSTVQEPTAQESTVPESTATIEQTAEIVMKEEAAKVDMDNLEDELRVEQLPKSSSEESFQSAQDTPPENPIVEITTNDNKVPETLAVDVNNPPTNIQEQPSEQPSVIDNQAQPIENKPVDEKPVDEKPVDAKPVEVQPVESKPVEEKPEEEKPVKEKPVEKKPVESKPVENKPVENKPVEDKPVETQATVQVTEEKQPAEEPKPTVESEPMDVTQNFKRQIDDSNVLDEPLTKRQRTERPFQRIDSNPDLQVIRRDDINQEPEPEVNEDLLTIDTTRTEYSTDVSQVTTPADTSDVNLREGTESVAGSESNAATPTTERKRSMLSKDDQRHKSWQKNINLLWREIANHKNGAMFMNPIKESIAPHYYEIVKRPMDLKTIKNRIRDGLINTTTEFERDVVLMLNNSLMYNKEGTEVYQLAREMLDDAMEQIKIFRTADTDTSASSHTRAASKKN